MQLSTSRAEINHIFIALPLMNEVESLPALMECLKNQTFKNFTLVVCVNQPDDWWETENKIEICLNNKETLGFLNSISEFPIFILDKSSKGLGWSGKQHGIGWARKTLMDYINTIGHSNDIVISMDGDTIFGNDYFKSIFNNLTQNQNAMALAVPYYHRLIGNQILDRALLRYEIYMRYYVINLWRIGSPYSFTALGSAIAFPLATYRKIGGLSPKLSGEDFYFLQKIRKSGELIFWNKEKVYPATRLSDRVYFGTGPALQKGIEGNWNSYPVYNYKLFDSIKETYDLLPNLFESDITTPMDDFIKNTFSESNIWEPLRKNFKTKDQFIRACHQKLDGLRLLQFLKSNQINEKSIDEQNLMQFVSKFYGINVLKDIIPNPETFCFNKSPISQLDCIRDFLCNIEENEQKQHYDKHFGSHSHRKN